MLILQSSPWSETRADLCGCSLMYSSFCDWPPLCTLHVLGIHLWSSISYTTHPSCNHAKYQKTKEDIQNNSVKFSKLEGMATHCVLFLPESAETNILHYDFQHQLNILLRWDLLKSLAMLTTMLSTSLLPSMQVSQSSMHMLSGLILRCIWHLDYTVILTWGTGVQ